MTTEEIQQEVRNSPRARLGRKLMALSFLPVCKHLEIATATFNQGFAEEIDPETAQLLISWYLPLMEARHTKWARAICPTGPLSPDAAMVGAVRLKDLEANFAAQDLGRRLCFAYQENNEDELRRLKTLCQAELGGHRNYQIWVAIDELRDTENFQPSRSLSAAATAAMGRKVEWKFFPNFKEVRAHVASQPDATRFSDLHRIADDDPAWTRVWRDSGAKLLMERGVRGQAAHQRR